MSTVNIEMDVYTAAAVRQALFREQDGYTHDPTCVPARIVSIRELILDIDNKIDTVIKSVEDNQDTEIEN